MRFQKNTLLMLMSIMFLPALIMAPTEGLASCYQPDAPDCPCFDSNGVWDPAGAFIQDVAIQTVGTKESCVADGGKPYYQMVLGCNNELCALIKAWLLSLPSWLAPDIDVRQAWCSETISYWHRETGIPYSGGYRHCGWHCNWLNYSVGGLKEWYTTEEDGGRGRWIEPGDVDYENYVLGVTLPVPGAYVSWQTYDDFNDTWVYDGWSHSLMINEMWLHKDVHGNLFQVEISLLEGNSSNKVKNERKWDDVLARTPQGSEWINGNKKIYGFGVDLDSAGQPIYDASRLHLVPWLFVKAPPQVHPVMTTDPMWEQHYEPYIPALKTYAKLLRQAGGEPNVMTSSGALQLRGIPDGNEVNWRFTKGLPGGEEVVIDLLDVHPLPIKGIELKWDTSALPGDYRVQYTTPGQPYQEAIVPKMPDVSQLPSGTSIPVPAIFNSSATAVQVRYVKLIFPNTFEQDAVLQELRFHYEQGPMADSEVCPFRILGDLDYNCRVDLYDVALMAGNWLIDCYLTPQNPACVPE